MADGSERTAQEREAARLERERRRSGRPTSLEPSEAALEPNEEALEFEDEEDGAAAEAEVPLGTRRVTRAQRQAPVRPARAPRRRPPAPVRRRHSLVGRALAVLAVGLAAAAAWFLIELFQPFHGSGSGSVAVTIPARASSREIGDLLARDHVVASGFFFDLRAALAGDRGALRAGTYHLKRDMRYGDVLRILTTAPPAAKVSNLTIVEGQSRRQIDALLHSEHLHGSYLAATRHSPLLDPRRYGAPRSTPSLEGFLFPSTYQLRDPVRMSALVADQLKTFKQEFARLDLRYARGHGLTPYDVVIIASIVEKEAATARDRPLVASVIYNRLADHIPLGMDSTTRYEFNDYNKPLTQSQLAAKSPYNTRLNAGLPPTPISNPGLSALEAAARPARTKYLYFVVKPCGNGASVFESSYSKFLADAQRYQNARSRRGGRSPSHC